MNYKSFTKKTNKEKFVNIKMLKVPEYYRKDPIAGNESFLAKSVREFGVKAPLIINTLSDRAGNILNGVQVYKECLSLNIKLIPVWEVELDVEQEKKLHALLNSCKAELSIEQLQKFLGKNYIDFFPELSSDFCTKIGSSNDVAINVCSSELSKHLPKRISKITFRYDDDTSKRLNCLKSLTQAKSINQLLNNLIQDAVDGGWYANN